MLVDWQIRTNAAGEQILVGKLCGQTQIPEGTPVSGRIEEITREGEDLLICTDQGCFLCRGTDQHRDKRVSIQNSPNRLPMRA